jgi:hypothetical protein
MAILGNGTDTKRMVGVLLLGAATLAAALGGASPSALGENPSHRGGPIEGTWVFTIHRVNQNVTFTAFQSFATGGVTLATGTIDRTPPPAISPLIGSWKRLGNDMYGATLCFFIFDTDGNAVNMFKNYMTLWVKGDNTLEGGGDADICDPDGSNCVVVPDQIVITGKRLIAQGARF